MSLGPDEKQLQRRSEIYTVPSWNTATGEVDPDWQPTNVVESTWGVLRVHVNGTDQTFFRGKPITVASWTTQEPFGDGPAMLVIPQVSPFEALGTGDLAWLQHGDPVDLYRRNPNGTLTGLWHGYITSQEPEHDQTSATLSIPLAGALFQADMARGKTPILEDPVDVGTAVADALTGVVSRRYGAVPAVTTGILTKNRGSAEQSPLGYAQELLATATTEDGLNQWTVMPTAPREYRIRLKDVDTDHWTLVTGQRGLQANLHDDMTDRPNVIYGRGIDDKGGRWANWKYPNLRPDDAPPYPNNDPNNVITVGETDANTDSGNGVTTWLRRAKELGYAVAIDGSYDSSDANVCRDIQRRYGIQVDGVIGPQTWAATFEVGSGAGDLTGAYRAPLAIFSNVDPYRYTADGNIIGENPNYEPTVMRVERELDFGPGVTKAQGLQSALQYLRRESQPGWTGTLTLACDPQEGSRLDIRAGQNIRLLGWNQRTIRLHIAQATHDPAGTTTLMVDSKYRDLMTVGQVIARNKQNQADPARMPGKLNRRSRGEIDTIVEYDAESSAGIIPRHALFGGLWNVLRIPVSQLGRIVRLEYTTDTPAARFCLALFGKPITAADLDRLVGSPLAERASGEPAPWTVNVDELEDAYGWIETFGTPDQSAGYYPGSQSNEDPITGRLVETSSIEYVSQRPPWIWVAEYSIVSCFGQGRLYPAPVI